MLINFTFLLLFSFNLIILGKNYNHSFEKKIINFNKLNENLLKLKFIKYDLKITKNSKFIFFAINYINNNSLNSKKIFHLKNLTNC